MIYFTADMHFGHKAIITMQNRPFESVEEMDRVLLQNYNAVVHKDDTVYILGDICHHIKIEQADELIKKMNGKKYLIKGNHDMGLIESHDDLFFLIVRQHFGKLVHNTSGNDNPAHAFLNAFTVIPSVFLKGKTESVQGNKTNFIPFNFGLFFKN